MTDPDPPEIRTVRRSGKRLVYDKKEKAIVPLSNKSLTPSQLRGLADWMVKHGAADEDAIAPSLTVLLLRQMATAAEDVSPAIDPDPSDRSVNIPERLGTNWTPKSEQHCAACGRFFKNFGNAVSMLDGNMHKRCADAYNKGIMSRVEWWEALHATYFAVFQKQAPESMKACVISHAIVDAYLSMETIARSLRPSEETVWLPCLYCGRNHEFALDSPEANRVLNVFCKGDCEDLYAAKQ